ncbi:MAG: thiol:disulfide interchange protein DsbA/DsbL [Pseudohongiellaceae bacterium]|jgi:thiol:disulfide interchange protein DsbA
MKLFTKTLLLVAMIFGVAATVSAQPSLYVEGTHYEIIANPVRTADPNKIEISEIFWYGCPHCYAFEPLITSWEEKLPSDVAFVRSPGMWNQTMEIHAQIYYAAEALGVTGKIHDVAFNEIHQRRNYLQTEDAIKDMFVSQGVAPADFDKAWKSFSVSSAVKRANTRMRDYGVRGVPSIVVNGKYLVSVGGAVPTQTDMLKIVDFLVQKERSES